MKVRHNHITYCHPDKRTEIFTPAPYWTFLSSWIEHDATLRDDSKPVLKIPNNLGPQSTMLCAPSSLVLNDVLALSPFRGHMVHPHLLHAPTRGCIPSCLTRALQRHSLQGCNSGVPPDFLMQQRHRKNKEGKWLNVVPLRYVRINFSMAEARAMDTENVIFLGQAPEVFTLGQILISTCTAVNPHQVTHWHSWEQILNCWILIVSEINRHTKPTCLVTENCV